MQMLTVTHVLEYAVCKPSTCKVKVLVHKH